jgi:uncharacterized membrane protein
MLGKSIRASRGQLREFSVVMEPQARLFGGVSNAGFGLAFYICVLAGIWLVPQRARWAIEAAAIAAAATSLYLARSLARKKLSCVFCWTSHAINWSLALLLPILLF